MFNYIRKAFKFCYYAPTALGHKMLMPLYEKADPEMAKEIRFIVSVQEKLARDEVSVWQALEILINR